MHQECVVANNTMEGSQLVFVIEWCPPVGIISTICISFHLQCVTKKQLGGIVVNDFDAVCFQVIVIAQSTTW